MRSDDDTRADIAAAVLIEKIARDTYVSKRSAEIQPLQWSILRYLESMPEDRRELRWIAGYLGLTRAPVGRALRTLEMRGLIEQHTSATDTRTNTVHLTKNGHAALAEDPILRVVSRLQSLPKSEKEQFKRSLRFLALASDGKQENGNGKDTSD